VINVFQIARVKYLESQKASRREIVLKKMEKNASRMIDDLIWGVPHGRELPRYSSVSQLTFGSSLS